MHQDNSEGTIKNFAIGIVIAAAGASKRLGHAKQLLPYRGRSLLRHVSEIAISSRCRPIFVVLPPDNQLFLKELTSLPTIVIENPFWEDGMSTSIRVGIQTALEYTYLDGVILMVCDQPLVSSHLIHQMCHSFYTSGKSIVACEYANTLGTPVLFSRDFFAKLIELKGDRGAKPILYEYAQEVLGIPFPGGVLDIDTERDYRLFCEKIPRFS